MIIVNEKNFPNDFRIPKRKTESHKGDYGKILVVGGSIGYTGAPTMAAKAALRTGAGLVYLGVPEEVYSIEATMNLEAMPFPLPSDGEGRLSALSFEKIWNKAEKCDVLAVGPGLGRSEELKILVGKIVEFWDKTLILDADALWAVSQNKDILKKSSSKMVLTPHEGEFKMLQPGEIKDRECAAVNFSKEYNVITVLKGNHTVVAFPDGDTYCIDAGNPGMAKGGSGDVLTGILAAMAGQFPLKKAVVTGTYLHSRAADIALEKTGEYSLLASDIIRMIPAALREIKEE